MKKRKWEMREKEGRGEERKRRRGEGGEEKRRKRGGMRVGWRVNVEKTGG